MMGYPYKKLQDGESDFRLLALRPGQWESDIVCGLHPASLASARPYEALSYVWGDPNLVRPIHLDGHLHSITSNLHCALQRLRLANQERFLWVDALCINQQDLGERSSQVKLMHEIYNKADRVLSWLGECSHDSDEAMQLLRELGQWARDHDEDVLEAIFTEKTVAIEILEKLGFPVETRNWPAFWELLHRPYWTRVWVIQELAASGAFERAKGTILCGSASVDRRLFDYACAMMLAIVTVGTSLQPGKGEMEEPMRSMLVKGHPPGLSMSQMLAACNPGSTVTLDWLLRLSSRFDSTEPRDKIYSLLGLVCDEHREFPPDYQKPLHLVLQELVQFLIRSSGNLYILLGNRLNMNQDGPTWTPILSREFHGDTRLNEREGNFAASAGRPPNVTFDPGTGTMTAKGLIAGKITRVFGPWKTATQIPTDAKGIRTEGQRLGQHEMLLDLRTFGRKLDKNDEEIFWRTLVMDCNDESMENTIPAPDVFGDMYRVLFGMQSVPEDFLPGASIMERAGQFSRPYHKTLDKTMVNRCFFTTECGRMGLGPYCTQVDDIVVVLLGSPICFVLRAKDSSYMLVGDAYVHGIMGGELVEDETQELQDFVLV